MILTNKLAGLGLTLALLLSPFPEVLSGPDTPFVSAAWAAEYKEGRLSRPLAVKKVYDGDTLELQNGDKVRILGIDTPELPHGGNRGQYFAADSKDALEDLVIGKKVKLRVGKEGRDHYGRVLAEVITAENVSAGEVLVGSGFAFCYTFPTHDPAMRDRLLAAQRKAMTERVGFWPRILDLDKQRQDVVGNKSSLRFYAGGCPEADNVKPSNRVRFGSVREAFWSGYSPARNCTPWPDESGKVPDSGGRKSSQGAHDKELLRMLKWLLKQF